MDCKRAVIAVGGVGSRMLPWAYSGEKCMVPLIDTRGSKPVLRPVIDFIVEDCIRAGITDITFVHGEGAHALFKHYQGNEAVEHYFISRGKASLLDGITAANEHVTFRFIEQSYSNHEYGTTVPVHLARTIVDQPGQTLYILGDQIFHNSKGVSEAAHFLQATADAGTTAGILALDVPADRIGHYGIFTVDSQSYMKQLVEKPAVGSIPSTLAYVGISTVDRSMLPFIDGHMRGSSGTTGEHLFTDVISAYCAAGNKVAIIPAIGTYLDCGTPENWLATNNYLANQA
jgi:UTP--glucose-1-phosphate uridylyltransferase